MGDYGMVSQKMVDGKKYTAWRHVKDPRDEYIEIVSDGKSVQQKVKIKDYWNDKEKLKSL